HQLARPGRAPPHSHPRKASPSISSSYVFLPNLRSSSRIRCFSARSPCRASLPARDLATLEQLLAPGIVERLRDLMLPAQLLHRDIAAQARENDLELLLNSEIPVPALLAQPIPSQLSGLSPKPRRTTKLSEATAYRR